MYIFSAAELKVRRGNVLICEDFERHKNKRKLE
jgi:hypothetical protein